MKDKRPKPLTDKAKRKKGVFESIDSMAIHKKKQYKKKLAMLKSPSWPEQINKSNSTAEPK